MGVALALGCCISGSQPALWALWSNWRERQIPSQPLVPWLACLRRSDTGAVSPEALRAWVAEGNPSLCPAPLGILGPFSAQEHTVWAPPRNGTQKGAGMTTEAAGGRSARPSSQDCQPLSDSVLSSSAQKPVLPK